MFILRPAQPVAMHVDIVPVGDVPAVVKREASSGLRSVYDCEVTLHDGQEVPDGAYDPGRQQYRAEEFIELASRIGNGTKNIAITGHDLYYRRRNYVFGLAYLSGNGSVISTYRLQTSTDGGFSNKPASEIFAGRSAGAVRSRFCDPTFYSSGSRAEPANRSSQNWLNNRSPSASGSPPPAAHRAPGE